MKIEVVIGANYGDEGKGMFTDFLCRNRPKPLVVLSNGGCQRGHTVNDSKTGVRHVFHHFGSGTLAGAPTVLSKTFLLNPMMFVKEFNELCQLGTAPEAIRMPQCALQLPGDMFINQQLEKHRSLSNARHGSCGWGIWETIVRNKDFKPLLFNDFAAMDEQSKRKCIEEALDWQIETRLRCEDGLEVDDGLLSIVRSENFIKHFIADFTAMDKQCPCLDMQDVIDIIELADKSGYETIVVENAQGLLLDKTYAPADVNGKTDVHSTPSNTGLKGALEALDSKIDYDDVTPNYISRSYFTRHGDGPFPEETPGLTFDDATNIPNDYQGAMRFGKFDNDSAKALLQRIAIDAHAYGCVPKLVLTHLNEARCMLLEENASFTSFADDSASIVERQFK